MSFEIQTVRCVCGNVKAAIRADGAISFPETQIKLPSLALIDNLSLTCLNCGQDLSIAREVANSINDSENNIGIDKISPCFGIVVGTDQPKLPRNIVQIPLNEKHDRKQKLRQRLNEYKVALRQQTEDAILAAQAECAWLCDRIQAADGECESSGECMDKDSSAAAATSTVVPILTTKTIPISKVAIPYSDAASPPNTVGSLLTRHLTSGIASSSPPVTLDFSIAQQNVTLSNSSLSQSEAAARDSSGSSSSAAARKVHFKESAALTDSTATTSPSSAPNVNVIEVSSAGSSSASLPSSKQNEQLLKTGGFSTSRRAMPSPAAPNGDKVVFSWKGVKEEDMFELDTEDEVGSRLSGTSATSDREKYLGDEEEEEEEIAENDPEGEETRNISLLSSSVPVAIKRDPRMTADATASTESRRKDKESEEVGFTAPHVVAKSFREASAVGPGSVVGRPPTADLMAGGASYRKPSAAAI